MTALQQYAVLVLRRLIWERDDGVCGVCLEPVALEKMHLDHVIPVSLGGEQAWDNLQPAHPVCNRKKGNKLGSLEPPTLSTIRFPASLRERALGVAQDGQRTFTSLVIYALRRYVTEHESEQERE